MSAPEKYLVLPWGRVRVPPEDENEYVAIRVSVLDRWLKHIDRLGRRYDNISAAYWALFGASIAMAAAVPPLLSAGLPSWIAPTYIVSAIAFFLLGVILVLVSISLRTDQSATASDIAQEMRVIREKDLTSTTPPVPEASPSDGGSVTSPEALAASRAAGAGDRFADDRAQRVDVGLRRRPAE